jgi:hypothetical protein
VFSNRLFRFSSSGLVSFLFHHNPVLYLTRVQRICHDCGFIQFFIQLETHLYLITHGSRTLFQSYLHLCTFSLALFPLLIKLFSIFEPRVRQEDCVSLISLLERRRSVSHQIDCPQYVGQHVVFGFHSILRVILYHASNKERGLLYGAEP